jgi:hypothetical protein
VQLAGGDDGAGADKPRSECIAEQFGQPVRQRHGLALAVGFLTRIPPERRVSARRSGFFTGRRRSELSGAC